MNVAFFGSSLVSSYWNGAATYYRGLLKAFAELGHNITFFEPHAFERQRHRDIPDPDWARVVVYPATTEGWQSALDHAVGEADLIVKASGVGVFDTELELAVPAAVGGLMMSAFWDVDAPATLETIAADPHHHLRKAIPRYDAVFTYGGGLPVVSAYLDLGARQCVPIYNGVDPTTHYPVAARQDLACDLNFLGHRLPDREARVEEFFIKPAQQRSRRRFILGGAGWETKPLPDNVLFLGHIGTADHNAFFCSALATLNINRESMVRYGFSPPTRVFEAAAAGTCIITDAWQGIELFFEPGREILVAHSGESVADILDRLTRDEASRLGEAARRRVLAEHVYARRAGEFARILQGYARTHEAAA
jgi:spore maturation protein CgeB